MRKDCNGLACRVRGFIGLLGVCVVMGVVGPDARGVDVSAPAFLQWFESSYDTMEDRTVDIFMAGYGAVWTPPPGRADLSDFSVGYDVYDRFDLGRAGRETLYGTETGLKTVANTLHRAGIDLHIDAVLNHNGFSDAGTDGFVASGGYPGFLLQNPDGGSDPFGVPGTDGDFHSKFASGDIQMRLAGLVDINHTTNWRFVRTPVPGFGVDPGNHGGNLPAGTTPDGAGRIANVPLETNRRFYPDRNLDPISVFNPVTGQGDIKIYPFNLENPMAGDPVGENAMGYLMRYMQWMVQEVGVDGFRIDAAKHMEGFVFDFMDQAVYRSNPRKLLDGSTKHVFSYSEVFDGSRSYLQSFVKKNIDPNDVGRIGGNRDVLDFPMHFAMKQNLSGNGIQNDWNLMVNAGMDFHDDGIHNGSSGVMFVQSHDEHGPHLGNVAHAFMLMHPGNAVVYMNGKEFGENRDFPKDGRGDALGGVFGDRIKDLVEIRNTHGRGDYKERWKEKENFAFEREGSALVLLSNRTDGGYDSRTVDVSFPFGTYLIELTGNARNHSDIPELIQVFDDCFGCQTKVNVRFLRNDGGDQGYLIYGLPTPQAPGGVQLTNVNSVLAGGDADANGYSNGRTRLTDLHVIKADSFTASLQTVEVNLLGSIRDAQADGDNALIKIDDGVDVNGNGEVDFRSPGSVAYGFDTFETKHSDLWTGGDGEFQQVIDTTQLSEGVHFIEIIAFRHREDGGPAVYSSFKKAIYVDRLAPLSSVHSFEPFDAGNDANRDLVIRSDDLTADTVHVFLNLPAGVSDEDVLSMATNGEGQAGEYDRDLFKFGFFDVPHGNNVATIVTFEETGTYNVQRVPGLFTETGNGAGLGDLNRDGNINEGDLQNTAGSFEQVLYSNQSEFNPSADVNGDGRVDTTDLLALAPIITANTGAAGNENLQEVYEGMLKRRADFNQNANTDGFDINTLVGGFGGNDFLLDVDSNGVVDAADVEIAILQLMRTRFGDANGDRIVNLEDLAKLATNFGGAGEWTDGDFTLDGVVNLEDLAKLATNFGFDESMMEGAGASGALQLLGTQDIPEPVSAVTVLLMGMLVSSRKYGRRVRV